LSDVHRGSASQIRQREGGSPVATVHRAQQRKQRLILVDRQQLTVAGRPTPGRIAKAEGPDLADERFTHELASSLITKPNRGSSVC